MRTAGSILAGVLVLAALEAALSSGEAAGRLGGLLTGTASVVQHLLDPAVALVPDIAGAGTDNTTAQTTAADFAARYDTPTKAKPAKV